MTPQRRKSWSYSIGAYGARLRVYERGPGGLIYAEVRDPSLRGGRGGYRKISLGHSDRDRAIAWAKQQQAELQAGLDTLRDPMPTVARVFGAYLAYRTPQKGGSRQAHDRRCAAMWTRVLEPRKDLAKLTRREWETFIDRRRCGAIDGQGRSVADADRGPVRDRTLEVDLVWLRAVLNWAVTWQDEAGRYLLRENPVRGYPMPREKNPRRPVATDDRFDQLRAVSDRVLMHLRLEAKRRPARSYLSEILDLVHETGRRISAVLRLRYDDLRLDAKPHGAIRWPADTDKMGKEWLTPISTRARAAVDRILTERPGIGAAYLFPAPGNLAKPCSKDLASAWLERAQTLAKLPCLEGGRWHPYRRAWATVRKHLPDKDVAAAGGWSDLASLKLAYQQVDPETLVRVVTQPAALRDTQHGSAG